MDAARKGIITPQMEIVAKKEYRTTQEIRQWVAEGKVALPANKHHECLNPEGVGSRLRSKKMCIRDRCRHRLQAWSRMCA